MKMKAIVLLAMMAVAMMAVSVSAWGQEDAAQGDGGGGSVGVSDRGDPVIKPLNPKPGEKIEDRTPTIKARVVHGDGAVNKNQIRLWLDNHRIHKNDFFYSHHDPYTGKERLKYTPDENLSPGKHTVKITAVQRLEGDRTTRRWSFRIVD